MSNDYTPVQLVETVENCGLCMRRCLACSSLRERYALHTCYYTRASFMTPCQTLNDVQMQATV